jgi:membrane protein required for colicin V production
MTKFDYIALVILAVSALVGFNRGAVRELVTVFAFTLAALAALYLMPVAGPVARRIVHPSWAANAAAVVVTFLVAYIALRLIAGWVTSRLHEQTVLGALDRTIGLCFGLVRAFVFLGVFYLVFNMATPVELVPRWISDGKLYPLARASARVIGALAPRALKASSHIGPAFERAVTDDGSADGAALPQPAPGVGAPPYRPDASLRRPENPHRGTKGYDKRSRDDIDALVERSR